MVLVFILLAILILILTFVIFVFLSTYRIEIQNAYLSNMNEKRDTKAKFKIILAFYLFNKIKWLSLKLDETRIKNLYSKIKLENLDLKPEHIMELIKYGFSIEDIEKIGFKSIPMNEKERINICNKLIQDNLDLEGIPGFFKDKRFRWNFKAHKGILVPVKESHRIIGLRIHLDNLYDADTSDIWFSSSQECNGSKILNNIMFLYPEENSIRFMNNNELKDIIIVSEMILAYKIHLYFNNNIVIGVPNVVSKKELKKLNKIQNVNEVHVVMDKHTVLHNSESLLANLYKIYPRRKVTLHFSLKDGEIPGSIEKLNNDYNIQEKSA